MKGTLHQRLRAELLQALRNGICTQESLGAAMNGKSHRSVGQYLADEAGALDLDEAAAALDHVGSTLEDFIAGNPPRELTPTERVARAVTARPLLMELVEDLRHVPKQKLADVIELARGLGRVARPRGGARTRESTSAPQQARRTKSAPAKRR